MSATLSPVVSPIFYPRSPKQLILINPGSTGPSWLTHIATLLDPSGAAAAFSNPRNNPIFTFILTNSRLLKLCKDFNREIIPNRPWTGHDERNHSDGSFGEGNLEREEAVDEVLEDLRLAFGVDATGFDERSTWALRAVEVSGPFEIRVDEDGHESVVEVPNRRHVNM